MTDQKDASPVFLQSFLQRIFCINIQMVCRFIQQKKIRIPVQKLAQAYLCLLATTQDPDLTFYVLCRQSTFCQCRADFILGTGRKLLPQLFYTCIFIFTFYFLFKVTDLQIISKFTVPFQCRISPRILFSNVVFPIPFVPTSATFCPRSIEKFRGFDSGSSYPVTRSFVSKSIFPGVLPYRK